MAAAPLPQNDKRKIMEKNSAANSMLYNMLIWSYYCHEGYHVIKGPK